MRHWASWVQKSEDFRPVYDAAKEPEPFDHMYWCSGEGEGYFTMCAVVDAKDEGDVCAKIKKYWPEFEELRFCEQKPDAWMPGGRFPMEAKP